MKKKASVASPTTPDSPRARTRTVLARAEIDGSTRESRAREQLDAIRMMIYRAAGDAWDLGHALSAFLRDKVYIALGYPSFAACLDGEHLLSRTQAYKLIRVAEHFSKEELIMLGNVDKGGQLVTYAEATPARDSAAALARQDALIGGKRVSKANVAELERATTQVLAAKKPKASAKVSPKEAARIAKAKRDVARARWLATQLRAIGIGGRGTRAKNVDIVTKGGKVLVEIDAAALDALMDADRDA